MSHILEILFEVAFNIIAAVLEMFADLSFDLPDTKASRIFLCVVIILIGAIIFCELL